MQLFLQATFLAALAGSTGINEPAMSVETLGQVYGPLQKRVAASIVRQEKLVGDIQVQSACLRVIMPLVSPTLAITFYMGE